jgi:tRNA (cmo5U34)-methyltransferase
MGKKRFDMIAVDNSKPMLATYRTRLENRPNGESIHLVCAHIQDIILSRASVVIINLTMQFLPVPIRDELICSIYNALSQSETGCP